MLTKWFKNNSSAFFGGKSYSDYRTTHLPVVCTDGSLRFCSGAFDAKNFDVTLTPEAYGISIGSGGTAPTEEDYNLESTITSGVSLQVSSKRTYPDADGNVISEINITVTNTGSSAVTVREIGLKLQFYCSYLPGLPKQDGTTGKMLADRTVLEDPITIEAGDAGVVTYRFKTERFESRGTKNGIELVSFAGGTDGQIAAMIDAAHQGLIDLHSDGGWEVGDIRKIDISAYSTDLGSVAATSVYIVITSFADYSSCGCVMQFDFFTMGTNSYHIVPSGTAGTGYTSYTLSVFYNTILPALANALPSWISSRLITFSAPTGKGKPASEIEMVPNNKLCLRSEAEIFGTHNASFEGEGVRAAFYSITKRMCEKRKCSDITQTAGVGSNPETYWLRSLPLQTSYKAVYVNSGLNQTGMCPNSQTTSYCFAPFGCL